MNAYLKKYFSNEDSYKKIELIEKVTEIIFRNNMIIFGGMVKSLLASEMPNDIDIAYTDSIHLMTFLVEIKNLYKTEQQPSTYDHHNTKSFSIVIHVDNVKLKLDLINSKDIGKDIDFDVNGLIMDKKGSVSLANRLSDLLNLFDVIKNIQAKQFNILKHIKNPETDNLYLVDFVKMQLRVSKMLSNGWSCVNSYQYLFLYLCYL